MNTEEALIQVMKSGTGYEIDMFGGMLYLRPLENLEFAVGCDDSMVKKEDRWEKCFKDPAEAVKLFEKVRKERKLGLEYEWGRDRRWEELIKENYIPAMTPFLEAASKDPVLHELYPFFSHTFLGFSEVSVYPFSKGFPHVYCPGSQNFFIQDADGKQERIGRDAEKTIMAVRELIAKRKE